MSETEWPNAGMFADSAPPQSALSSLILTLVCAAFCLCSKSERFIHGPTPPAAAARVANWDPALARADTTLELRFSIRRARIHGRFARRVAHKERGFHFQSSRR